MPKTKIRTKKKAGLIYTRFGQTDGVSLQSLNLRAALENRGFKLYTLAGEAPPNFPRTTLVPLAHFSHPAIQMGKGTFSRQSRGPNS